jgi:hypothetical protein
MAIEVPQLAGIGEIEWSMAEQTGDGTTITTILHGKANHDAAFNHEDFEKLREDRIGDYGWYAGHSINYGYGRQYDEITVTAIELIVPYQAVGYYSTFRAVANTQNFPLERKTFKQADDEIYATWWNHNVSGVNTLENLTAGEITTWKAITDGTIPASFKDKGYYWSKTNQARKANEVVFLDARYPGVQTFAYPVEQIQEVVYARDEQTVKDIINIVGWLETPRDHAGTAYDPTRIDNTKWLVQSASYKKNLGWYEADIRYLYAEGGHEEGLYPDSADEE